MSHKKDKTRLREEDVERAVFDALRQVGWILPRTPAEVLRAEIEMAESPVDLPEGLSDPYAILQRPSQPIRVGGHMQVRGDAMAEQNLAQAAREGGETSQDVNEQMRRDREAAERKGNE